MWFLLEIEQLSCASKEQSSHLRFEHGTCSMHYALLSTFQIKTRCSEVSEVNVFSLRRHWTESARYCYPSRPFISVGSFGNTATPARLLLYGCLLLVVRLLSPRTTTLIRNGKDTAYCRKMWEFYQFHAVAHVRLAKRN